MEILTAAQQAQFSRDGVLVIEDAVSGEQLQALRHQFADWVEESKGHTQAYGSTIDGRPRFDLQPGHSADTPGLRRVNAPTEVSEAYYDVLLHSRMNAMVADLIGPNVGHHHNKINSKLPGTRTQVAWHQDFPFTPHCNTDLVTAPLMIDEVTEHIRIPFAQPHLMSRFPSFPGAPHSLRNNPYRSAKVLNRLPGLII